MMEYHQSHVLLVQPNEIFNHEKEEKDFETNSQSSSIIEHSETFNNGVKYKLRDWITSTRKKIYDLFRKRHTINVRFLRWMVFSNILLPILYPVIYYLFSFVKPFPICEGSVVVDSNGRETFVFVEITEMKNDNQSLDEFGCNSNPNFFEFSNTCTSSEKFIELLPLSLCQLMCIGVNLIITSYFAFVSIKNEYYQEDKINNNFEEVSTSVELSDISTVESIIKENYIIENQNMLYLCCFRKLLTFFCFIIILLIYSSIILEIIATEVDDTIEKKFPILLIAPLLTIIFTKLLTLIGKLDFWEESVYFFRLLGSSSFYLLNLVLLYAFIKNVFCLLIFKIKETDHIFI